MKHLALVLTILLVKSVLGNEHPMVGMRALLLESGGDTITLAIQLELENDWHLYWKQPGDSGLPPRFHWEGATVVAMQWPTPRVHESEAGTTFVLEHGQSFVATLLMNGAEGPRTSLEMKWLACHETCVSGSTMLAFDVNELPRLSTRELKRIRKSHPAILDSKNLARVEDGMLALTLPSGLLPFLARDLHLLAAQEPALESTPAIRQKGNSGTVEILQALSPWAERTEDPVELLLLSRGLFGKQHALLIQTTLRYP